MRVFGSLCLNLRRPLSVCVWAAMFELALVAICLCLGRYVCVVVGVKCQGVRFTVTLQMSVNVVNEKT